MPFVAYFLVGESVNRELVWLAMVILYRNFVCSLKIKDNLDSGPA